MECQKCGYVLSPFDRECPKCLWLKEQQRAPKYLMRVFPRASGAGLALRSSIALAFLFGLVFAVGMAAIHYLRLPLWVALGWAVVVVGIQFWIGPSVISWIFRINWGLPSSVSPRFDQFLRDTCRERGLPLPQFGIIEDGNPNAFTFGHYPGNARVVVTRGLIDILDEEELEAVVGHELGHIAHWDFVVMTLATLVPLILYVIFRFSSRMGRGRSAAAAAGVAISAYIAYIISSYVALLLSRYREYFADEYGGYVTKKPQALASALVKIAWGLAGKPKEKEERRSGIRLEAARTLGIFDPAGARYLAVAAASLSGTYSTEAMTQAMRWDLWNPWGSLFELQSSHPLPAKRIRALANQAIALGEEPGFYFAARQPESYWDEFLADVFVGLLPWIGAGLGALAGLGMRGGWLLSSWGAVLLGGGVGTLLYLRFAYPFGVFQERRVEDLVREVKVSPWRPVPASLQGEVIGRGIPGLVWSEDLVIRDDTGFMVMDYRQPLRVLEFLFGAFRAESFIGEKVEARGWYRRGPRPYLELWQMWTGRGKQTCWVYPLKLAGGLLAAGAGIVLILSGLA